MSVQSTGGLRLDLVVPCERFDVELRWETDRPALGLFGPSGAGKTTVLEALAGLRRDARGRIEVAGRVWLDTSSRGRRIDLPPERRGVGYVPQGAQLFPHLDVLGNLRLAGRRARNSPRRIAPERVLEVLELGPLARRDVRQLSGGERQRVALARALCSAPELLLLDEPLAGLDLALRRRVLGYLLRVRREFGIPTLHVSHDPAEMSLLATEVSVLGAGRLTARGDPDALFGGQLLPPGESGEGVVNVLSGTVTAVGDSLAAVEVGPGFTVQVADDGALAIGQRVAFELRGSEILLARGVGEGEGGAGRLSAQNVVAASVHEIHRPPASDPHTAAVVTARVGSASAATGPALAVVVSQRACRELELAPGSAVHLIFKAQACRPIATL